MFNLLGNKFGRIKRRSQNLFKGKPPLIGILTDFGNGNAIFRMKQAILKIDRLRNFGIGQIHDIDHDVPPQNILVGGWRLKKPILEAEFGDIFVAVVDPGVGSSRKPIIARTKSGVYLIGPNNGVFTFALESAGLDCAYTLENPEFRRPDFSSSSNFEGLSVFAPAAAYLSTGIGIEEFGNRIEDLVKIILPYSTTKGAIVDIDGLNQFGNLRTNLPKESLESLGNPEFVKVSFVNHTHSFTLPFRFAQWYAETELGTPLLNPGSSGTLELSVNCGNAAKRFGVDFSHVNLAPGTLEPNNRIMLEAA